MHEAPKSTKVLSLLPTQWECFNSSAEVAGMCGGIGSGKSYYLAFEFINWIKTQDPRSMVLAVANTRDQLDKSLMKHLKTILEECGYEFVARRMPPEDWDVPLRNKLSSWFNTLCTRTGHIVVLASFERKQDIRGAEYGLILLEECAFPPTDEEGFDIVLGRMRCKYATHRKLRFATSPPPDPNWFWKVFASPEKRPGYEIYHCDSHENTFLDTRYLKLLESSYSDVDYDREVGGLFRFRGTNRCYTEYNPEKHNTDWEYVPEMEIFVGADFNRSPLCWCYAQEDSEGTLHVFDELFIEREATTVQACDRTLEKFPEVNFGDGPEIPPIVLYPDATASYGHTVGTSGLVSDLDIIRDYGIEVVAPFLRNPPQPERVEAVQSMFRDKRLKVSIAGCPKLVNSLLSTMHVVGTRKIAKTKKTGDVGEHMSDALGYMVMAHGNDSGVVPVRYSG